MAENGSTEKSIETRLLALEEKLAKIFITEDEMKAYLKVKMLIGCAPADTKSETGAGPTRQCATAQTVARVVNRDIIDSLTHADCKCTCGRCCEHSSNNILARSCWASFSGSNI
jgi:hypothetical protein